MSMKALLHSSTEVLLHKNKEAGATSRSMGRRRQRALQKVGPHRKLTRRPKLDPCRKAMPLRKGPTIATSLAIPRRHMLRALLQ